MQNQEYQLAIQRRTVVRRLIEVARQVAWAEA
jgi:hypothetical protein